MKPKPTPETDGVFMAIAVGDFIDPHKDALRMARDHCEKLERERDEARARCGVNAKQLLETVNDRNSLGTQIDLLRDEFQRIVARVVESGLSDNQHLRDITAYCQRAQKDIAVRYTPIEERDRAYERIGVLMMQLDDCKAQRDELLAALEDIANMPEHDQDDSHRLRHKARAAIAAVKGEKQ